MVTLSVDTLIPKYMKSWNLKLLGKGRRVFKGNCGKNLYKVILARFELKGEDEKDRQMCHVQIKVNIINLAWQRAVKADIVS